MQSGCNDRTTTATNKKPDTSVKQTWAMLGFIKADSVNPVLITGTNSFKDPIIAGLKNCNTNPR
jgi:hypothetical protein